MDTNVIIAIVAVVVIAALLAIGGWWFGKSRKSAVDKSTEAAKAKAMLVWLRRSPPRNLPPQVPKTRENQGNRGIRSDGSGIRDFVCHT